MPRTRTVPTATDAYATATDAYATTAIADATAANAADESTVMKLYSHIVTADTGLAPNPFHGYCTSALCTPSHSKRIKIQEGDWLIGHSGNNDGYKLIYAMLVSRVLTFDDYFHHPDFQSKKPVINGEPNQQCGDNLYFRDEQNNWKRLPSRFHNTVGNFIQDVGEDFEGRRVYVAKHFYYFGCNRLMIPDYLSGVIQDGRGIKGPKIVEQLAHDFVTWLKQDSKPGVWGEPMDFGGHESDTGPFLTGIIPEWIEDGIGKGKINKGKSCKPKTKTIFEKQRQRMGRC